MSDKKERTAAERAEIVEQAIHSVEMEGLPVSEAARRDAQEYIDGTIDSSELVARARERCGLPRER